MAGRLNILLVDQNAGALTALREELSFATDLEFVGDAGLGPVALTWARTLQPEIILVGLEEPAARALATIQLLAKGSPPWTVLALTSHADRELFRKAVLAGSTDVLLRAAQPRELRAALIQARRADLTRRSAPAEHTSGAPAGSVISVVGVKGGIGKTTIATNLAVSLAEQNGSSVALVDLDLPFGDIALMLDLHPERDITHALDEAVLEDPDRLQAQLAMGPNGINVLPAPLTSGRTPPTELDGRKLSRLLTRLASLYEFVVVDTPPGLSETAAAALDVSALALLVTTPEGAALRRTQAYLRLLASLDYPMDKVQVILNRAMSKTGIEDDETEGILGMAISWRIRNDYAAMKGAAQGRPAVVSDPRSPLAWSIRAIARQIAGLEVERPPLPRWRTWLPQVAATNLLIGRS